MDCHWDVWGDWSPCSPTCGDTDGTRMRSRTKLRELANNGAACEGDEDDDEPCSIDPCPGMKASPHYCHMYIAKYLLSFKFN